MTCRCGKPLPDLAVKDDDPFCSARCAMLEHGVAEVEPTPAASSAASRGYAANITGPPVAVTVLQLCRRLVDERARRREGIRTR